MTDAAAPRLSPRLYETVRLATRAGFDNAGRTYNTGNWIALCAAAAAAVAGGEAARGAFANLGAAFFGSIPALLVTGGTLAFFVGGARYDAAYAGSGGPEAGPLNQGHALSGVGAILVAFGLAGLATTTLGVYAALCGGAIHAAGKLGSAVSESRSVWKWLPLASRVFSVVSLCAGLGPAPAIVQSLTVVLLIICIGIWARADIMLLSDRQARSFSVWLGCDRGPGRCVQISP